MNLGKLKFLITISMISISTLCSLIQASSFYPQPFSEKVQEASVIARGKVGMSYADWGNDQEGIKRIYTYVELQLIETFKGNASGSSIMIRELGGEKDGVGLQISGVAQFQRGEDVVALLKNKNSDGVYDVQGMMMGKYGVLTDSNGVEYLSGPGLWQPTSPTQWTLEALRHLIQTQSIEAKRKSESSPLPLTLLPNHEKNVPVQAPPQSQTNAVPAPHLQSSDGEESSPSKSLIFYFGLGIGALGILGIIAQLLRIERRKK